MLKLLPFFLAAVASGQILNDYTYRTMLGGLDGTGAQWMKPFRSVVADQSGACSQASEVVLNTLNAKVFVCVGGTWQQLSGGGGGGGGITTLEGLTASSIDLATGTAGTDFAISGVGSVITFNLPTASASARGLLGAPDWTTFNAKESPLTFSSPLSRATNTISLTTIPASLGGLGANAAAFSGMLAITSGAAYVATAADLPAHDHTAANQGGTLLLQNLGGAVTDPQVPDTITASNYLLLAGGTLTGNLITSNLGVEFAESDTNPTCGAGDFRIFSDFSENKLKKCENGSVTDMDTTGGTPSFATLTGGTNTAAAMLVGTGASLGPTGSGTISANRYNGNAVIASGDLATTVILESDISVGLTVAGGAVSWAPETRVNSVVLFDGSQASRTITAALSGASDPVWTYSDGIANLSTGVLQQGGTPVVLGTRTLTGGAGIAAIGDLSADRTVTFDATELTGLTWSDGASGSINWTWNVSTGTDPAIAFGNNSITLTGVLNATVPVFTNAATVTSANAATLSVTTTHVTDRAVAIEFVWDGGREWLVAGGGVPSSTTPDFAVGRYNGGAFVDAPIVVRDSDGRTDVLALKVASLAGALKATAGVVAAVTGSATDCVRVDGSSAACVGPGAGSYTQAFTSQTSVSLTHALNTKNVLVSCYDGSDNFIEWSTLVTTTTSAATVTFTSAQTGRCTVAIGGGGTRYATTFASQTSVTITGATHNLGTADLQVQCRDSASPRQIVEPNTVTVDDSTFDVVITFTAAQSGRCSLI